MWNAAAERMGRRRDRVIALLPLVLAGAMFVAGCDSVKPVVKIGLVGPFEGRHRPLGYDVIYSARLAIREANQAGDLGRYRVALVALDDSGDPEMAAATASAMAVDPGIVAVIGHWLPETSLAAAEVYEGAGLPFVSAGRDPFGASDPSLLPVDFRKAYEEVTPFDEVAGPHAGAAYDAVNLVLSALALAGEEAGSIDRKTVASALREFRFQGLTGEVYQP